MIPAHPPNPSSIRYRRIGRKVLLADRLSRALGSGVAKKSPFSRLKALPRWKMVAISCTALVTVGIVCVVGMQLNAAQVADSQKAATEQQKNIEVKSAASAACRSKKAEEKADLIGKVTYDELYDYGTCDK